jgi:hypothetical protein
MEALGIKLLRGLSSSLASVEGVSTAEHRNELRECRRKVDSSLNVLRELGRCADRASVSANVSPITRKRPKVLARHTQLDSDPFDCMGIAVPRTEGEIRVVYDDVLPQLRSTLGVRCISMPLACLETLTRFQHYLLVLRRPRVSDVFKRHLQDLGSTTASPESTIRPIKAALYFENVEGFGEWRILLSTRAQKYLREVRRGNVAMFDIVVKKIK